MQVSGPQGDARGRRGQSPARHPHFKTQKLFLDSVRAQAAPLRPSSDRQCGGHLQIIPFRSALFPTLFQLKIATGGACPSETAFVQRPEGGSGGPDSDPRKH